MPTEKPKPPRPRELTEARQPAAGQPEREAHTFCRELTKYAGRDDYHWGFRLLRTAYSPTCTDKDFEKAVEVLHEYMRYYCFQDIKYDDSGNIVSQYDDKPEQQLWQRLRNDIVQDQSLLDRASPSELQRLSREWIGSRGARIAESSRYRFFVIMDEKGVRNLLKFSTPVVAYPDQWQEYSVKLVDVEFDESQIDEEWRDPMEVYEGWSWAAAWKLPSAWFLCHEMEPDEVYTFDDDYRPMQCMTAY